MKHLNELKKSSKVTTRFCLFYVVLLLILSIFHLVTKTVNNDLNFIVISILPMTWLAQNQLKIINTLETLSKENENEREQ